MPSWQYVLPAYQLARVPPVLDEDVEPRPIPEQVMTKTDPFMLHFQNSIILQAGQEIHAWCNLSHADTDAQPVSLEGSYLLQNLRSPIAIFPAPDPSSPEAIHEVRHINRCAFGCAGKRQSLDQPVENLRRLYEWA
jgi:hypothetical protein